MSNRLSFYIHRDSLVHRMNPLTKLVVVFTFIVLAFWGPGYWLPTGLFGLIILFSFVSKVNREFARVTGRLLLPAVPARTVTGRPGPASPWSC